jgi:BMFP domain-containing protein YqiC
VGEGTKRRVQEIARELGLVTRDEWDELELRVAQLEHRLRLVEDRDAPAGRP